MRHIAAIFVVLGAVAPRLAAQDRWTMTLEAGQAIYSRAAHDTGTPPVSVHVWRPTLFTLRVARQLGRFSAAIGVTYGKSGLGGSIEELTVVQRGQFEIGEVAPELGVQLFRTSTSAELRLHAGPVWDLWGPAGYEFRTRIGGMGGVTLALPLMAGWRVDLRGDLAVTGSYLNKADETPDVHRDAIMRRGRIALGVTRRL